MRVRFVRLLAATTSAAVVVATVLPQVSGGAPAESRNSVDGRSADWRPHSRSTCLG
jgi:hypothetical protein